MSSDDQVYRRMQVKVLYSFDNSPTVFLSRSKNQYSVKVAQIPIASNSAEQENMLMLGAFDLKQCAQQILKSSPENFRLLHHDYAVYYKDITEQPDEPFVANGVMSSLLSSQKQHLIPGRVCQNLSASFLFGDKASSSSLTLEIRLKLHIIEKPQSESSDAQLDLQKSKPQSQPQSYSIQQQLAQRRQRPNRQQSSHSQQHSSSSAAVKATRTKSLPIFYHPPNQQISNIINADKANGPSKYDNKSIMERFNLAPFLLAKIIDKPASKRRRSKAPLTPTVQTPVDECQPTRAVRTRSMVTNTSNLPMISSPIQEELVSEGSDDNKSYDNGQIDEEDEEDEDDDFEGSNNDLSSPYTPQQPPYKPDQRQHSKSSNNILTNGDKSQFQSLPDLEDLDSKKTHTIPSHKLPHDHDLVCINRNCAANDSVTWRYFETKFRPSYLHIHRAEKFDKKLYDGMFGPLCNACYLFLRNKGFMRPEAVVKKYLQQQKYKKELKLKEGSKAGSSPFLNDFNSGSFPTPSHAPSAINEVIRNLSAKQVQSINLSRQPTGQSPTGFTPSGLTPNMLTGNGEDYQDLNDFMNQLNSFGGPLTDLDVPHDYREERKEATPPMVATKSNTRVINLYEDEDKENCPPDGNDNAMDDFDEMIMKSFSLRSSPDKSDLANFFGEPTPIDNANTPQSTHLHSNTSGEKGTQARNFKSSPPKLDHQKAAVVNMPSSPLLSNFDHIMNNQNHSFLANTTSSPNMIAKRNDTTMSYVKERSSPQSEPFGIGEEYDLARKNTA